VKNTRRSTAATVATPTVDLLAATRKITAQRGTVSEKSQRRLRDVSEVVAPLNPRAGPRTDARSTRETRRT
jgi:hypothetical protein